MDSTDLRFFLAVAEEGGIGKAARRLNCVQSNVTMRIRELEAELKAQLLHRESRGVSLTRTGEALLPYAQQVVSLIAQAKSAVQDSPEPRGPLVLGSMDSTAAVRLPPILVDYHARFPAVELTLLTAPPEKLVEDVLQRRLDAAFIAAPVDHPDLIAEPVFEEDLVVIAAPTVAWPMVLRQSPRKLTLLAFHVGCPYRSWVEHWFARRGIRSVRTLEFGTIEGILGGVAAGIGVALLPKAVVAASRLGQQVRQHVPEGPRAMIPTVVVRRHDTLVTSALAKFLDCARKRPTRERPKPRSARTRTDSRRRRRAA